jgi:predicted nucleic acid-binding protein
MTRQLLDTPLLSALLLQRPAAVQLVTPWMENAQVATSILVYGEVNEYIRGRPDYDALHTRLLDLLSGVPPLFLTYSIMRRYGDIRRALRRTNDLIGDFDTLIAATALERDLTVVTADRDFERISNLNVTLIPRSQLARRATR